MGYGYEFECRNCQHKYSISLGSGFLYPKTQGRFFCLDTVCIYSIIKLIL